MERLTDGVLSFPRVEIRRINASQDSEMKRFSNEISSNTVARYVSEHVRATKHAISLCDYGSGRLKFVHICDHRGLFANLNNVDNNERYEHGTITWHP